MFQIDEDRLDLVKNLYVANVRNRLRELETPDTNLQKRWIWELIQNAKDCSKEAASYIKNPEKLPYKRKSQTVNIKIVYEKSKGYVYFMHDGFPFTSRTLDSLMYKNSTKESDDDSTGRFGTGFMTSHTLSRIVEIDAPFYSRKKDGWDISYIHAVVYREGSTDKQLKQEFDKMEKSKKIYQFDPNNEQHKWTIFTYQLTNELGIQSAELGIQSFKDNIMKVLLFCEEINSIQLNDEPPIYSNNVSTQSNLTQTLIKQNIFKNVQVIEKAISYSKQRKFIVASVHDPNKQYSEKYAKDHDKDYVEKELKFSIAFEVDSNNNLVNLETDNICLFCTFPLIGSENYQFPFILNSPHFETFTERNGIILEGDKIKSDILSNTGLNCLIIDSSIELFRIILQWLIQNNYSNFASFSNGLIFNSKTLPQMKPFLMNLREILENSKIIHNSENVQTVFKQTFILDFNNIKEPKAFHNLASQFYTNVASFEECLQWQHKTWPSISVLYVETFVSHIDNFGKDFNFNPEPFQLSHKVFKSGLNSLKNNDFNFLNEFYIFLLKKDLEKSIEHDGVFNKYNIILNSNNQFAVFRSLKSDSRCSKDFKKIMELCPSWKNKIINPKISCFEEIISGVTINDAIREINLNLDKNQDSTQFCLSFIRYTIKNNEHRLKMYSVAKLFYNDIQEEINVTDVDEEIWLKVDQYLLKKINNLINNEKGKKFTKSLKTLNAFYQLYQQFNTDGNFLVPNVNSVFMERNKLGFISSDIESVLLEKLGPSINLTQYAHPSITSVSFKTVFNLDNLIQTINTKEFYYKGETFFDDHFFSVISIIPPESNQRLYNFQSSICELAQFFFCLKLKKVPTKIVNELFWKKANEIFIDGMSGNLYQRKNISDLAKSLVKDENSILYYLNMYYEVLSIDDNPVRQKKAVIPNYKGKFAAAKKLMISNGISEELFDLYNAIKPESDIRENFAHPKIKCNFLNTVDFRQFFKTICEGITDDQLVNDTKVLQAISDLSNSKTDDSFIQEENEILLQKLYIANIKNRLNEIQNPTENDKVRWPWELIQNAKDSLYAPSNVTNQKEVEILIEVNTDPKTNEYTEIKFSHNGPPFTENSFIGLFYKISQEKNNPKTTGRFGTGFIATHVLSKVVQVKSNRINRAGKISGFIATLYRKGINDSDIIDDFKAMQRSQKRNLTPFEFTTFIYEIKSEESREYVKLGLKHLKEHISTALINCPEIKSIVLNQNGKQVKYFVTGPERKKVNSITYSIYDICANSDIIHRFIALENKDNNINISIEIDGENKIVPIKKNTESISIVFPLVGSYLHKLPFYLNSPKFEPSTERNALILNGKEKIDGALTNTGINRFLLMKCTDLYKDLITVVNAISCGNIFNLTNGLMLSREPYSTFDLKWYRDNFLKDMKNIASYNIYIDTELGEKVLLKDAFFPSNEINNNILQQFIDLAKRYYKSIVSFNDAIIMKDKIWKELNIVDIESLVNKVENDSSLFDDHHLSYLNNFLGFIWKINRNILYEHKLIPDMNNKLHCLSKEKEKFDMKESKTVQGQIIDIMESIEIKWRTTHMSSKINSITLPEDKLIDAESRIIEKVKENNEMCYEIMKFILKDNEFRKCMFYFVTELQIRKFSAVLVEGINQSIWEYADNYVINRIILMVSNFSPEKVKSSFDFFKILDQYYQAYQKDEDILNSAKIFPNAKFVLRKRSELKCKNDSFHDFLNPIMIKYFGIDLNDDILHPEINELIQMQRKELLNDILIVINDKILKIPEKEKAKQLDIAEKIICLIPQEEEEQSKQMYLFFLYQALINRNIEVVPISPSDYNEYKWANSNKIILMYICKKIEETKTLDNFIKTFNISDNELCFTILNYLYAFASSILDNYKIIPNQKGEFKYKKHLREDPGIEGDLIECISYFNPEKYSTYDFADKRVQVEGLEKVKVATFYNDLFSMFAKALKQKDVDPKIIDMINKIAKIDEIFDTLKSKDVSEDQKARIKILQKAHVQFLENRLRELNSPKKSDFKRWPFELIQNANDTLFSLSKTQVGFKKKKKVHIEFDFQPNKVVFSHDGLPFTNDSLFALLYQCSEGKRNDTRSTGKFGTGFLSTHILSKIIDLSGDVITHKGKLGFKVTINREGKDDTEIKTGVEKMEESLDFNQEIQNITKFEFSILKNQKANKAYLEGLDSLKNNVFPILIFNPTIESISIKTKNEVLIYKANHEEGNIQTITRKSNLNNQQQIFKFILINSKQNFDSKTIINISCLLPINNNNEIMKMNDETIFVSYPIFTEKGFRFPFIINSPNFEPDVERNGIIIQPLNDPDESKESLINKFIIAKSTESFEKIISIAMDMNCTKFYNIGYGLKSNINTKEYFKEDFYDKMKKIFLSFPIFETSRGMRKIEDILIPLINNYTDFIDFKNDDKQNQRYWEDYQYFYNLVSQLVIDSKLLVEYNSCTEWIGYLWESFPSTITINGFVSLITKYKNISELKLTTKGAHEKIFFILNTITFLQKLKNCANIFQKNPILLNEKESFVSSEQIIYFDIPQFFFGMFDIINFDYKEQKIHHEIENLFEGKNKLFNILKLKDAIDYIKYNISDKNAIYFMKYLIKDDKKREQMFDYTKTFLYPTLKAVELPDLSTNIENFKEMFDKADKIIFYKLLKNLEKCEIGSNINYFMNFVNFVRESISYNEFLSLKIFPNQKYNLCFAKKLKIDDIRDDNFEDVIKRSLKIDFKNELMLNEFADLQIISLDHLKATEISQRIIASKEFHDIHLIEQSLRYKFYSIIFQYSEKNETINQILSILNFFLNAKINDKLNSIEKLSNELTSKVINIVVNEIISLINKFSNIFDMISIIENDKKKQSDELIKLIFYNLNILYNFTTKGKIFPNQMNQFCKLDDIYWIHDQRLGNDQMERLLEYLVLFSQSDEIKKRVINSSVFVNKQLRRIIKTYDLKYLSSEILKCVNQTDQKLYTQFLKFIRSSNDLKIAFEPLLKSQYEERFDQILDYMIGMGEEKDLMYRSAALVYEALRKSKKYSIVVWHSRSESPTKFAITLENGNKYYINEKNEYFYEIYAENSDKKKFYFEVKGAKDEEESEKISFYFLKNEFNYAKSFNQKDSYFILVLVKNVLHSPEFVFLTKQKNEAFI